VIMRMVVIERTCSLTWTSGHGRNCVADCQGSYYEICDIVGHHNIFFSPLS
jgi:hypothetical protein